MRYMAALLLIFGTSAFADEGVLFSYQLEEERSSDDITTSEFGFLVHFDKEASADLAGTASIDMLATDEGDSVLVNLKLNDYLAEETEFVGTTSVSIPYGSSHTVTWTPPNYGTYRLTVTPKRHTIQ